MKRYYSPQIDRDLVSALYHEAKARGIPMTRLAKRLLHAALRSEGVERENEARKISAAKNRGQENILAVRARVTSRRSGR